MTGFEKTKQLPLHSIKFETLANQELAGTMSSTGSGLSFVTQSAGSKTAVSLRTPKNPDGCRWMVLPGDNDPKLVADLITSSEVVVLQRATGAGATDLQLEAAHRAGDTKSALIGLSDTLEWQLKQEREGRKPSILRG